ncbi:hypothetical protein [Flavisolibacter nicotianae]|uniref:hypothetical protein n=1 Tax=Flavisolibacter nicotianae TaxID=2364882 RepID=UPI0013C51E9B|nr:hypothetical protein [Flavisolibacter nicotianae]
MKVLFISILAAVALVQQKCNRESLPAHCYKGRLEIKAICGNYTISVLEGAIDSSQVENSWTDENTKKTYRKVFALANPCSFPDSIREGQEFYFTPGTTVQNCMVCQAYYPKPAKALAIRVLDKPCR